jgi:hypothetical protein
LVRELVAGKERGLAWLHAMPPFGVEAAGSPPQDAAVGMQALVL